MNVSITGLGVVSAAGQGLDPLWKAASSGTSCLRPVRRFSTEGFSSSLGGEIPEFPDRDRLHLFAREACRQALGEARLTTRPPLRIGIAMGTTLGAVEFAEDFLRRPLPVPTRLPGSLYHAVTALLSEELDLDGPCLTFDVACSSSLHAIGYAAELLEHGEVDVMIAGGVDVLSPFVFAGFHSLQALARDCVRSFDQRRDGMLIGEGAGVLILEREEHARSRDVRSWGTLRGWGFQEDAVHLTAPDRTGNGMARTIRHALTQAEIEPREIGYVNAHGTGTRFNDRMEVLALLDALGPAARKTPVSSIKGVIGHCLGASGVIETALSLRALREQVVPPTPNWAERDPELPLDFVPGNARPHSFDFFLKLAAGFGGQNGALILQRPGIS